MATPEDAAEQRRIANAKAMAEAANAKISLTPAQIAKLSPSEKANIRKAIAARTKTLTGKVIPSLTAAEESIPTPEELTAAAEESARAAEAATKEAEAAAAEATTQMEEGNKLAESANRTIFIASNLPDGIKTAGKTGDAVFAAIVAQLSNLGIDAEELLGAMYDIRKDYPDISSEDALTLLKYDKRYNAAYTKRFYGNVLRAQNGLPPLDDKEYLANEAAYNKIFTAYGLKQFANRDWYTKYIGNAVAPDEVTKRVNLAVDRYKNAPKANRDALATLYPELTDVDIIGYMLDPENQLPALQRKINAAEIGGAALAQSLSISMAPTTFTGAKAAPYSNVTRGTIGVEAMMAEGADAKSAKEASQFVAGVLPEAEKLSSIYGKSGYEQYGQLQAEQEAYQGLASAERARRKLSERETVEFAGEKGMAQTAFLSQTAGMI